jgi:hypothetical protein
MMLMLNMILMNIEVDVDKSTGNYIDLIEK